MTWWRENILAWHRAAEKYAPEPPHLDIQGPASKRDVKKLEKDLAKECPAALREFLLENSGHINFWWYIRDGVVPLDVTDGPCGGYIEFNIPTMRNIDASNYWQGPHVPQNANQWSQSWAFLGAPNGDLIVLDVASDHREPPVIYLNHEEPENWHRLAGSFDEFMESWTRLGCVGPESWVLRHFLTIGGRPFDGEAGPHLSSQLDPTCPNAAIFRRFFGLAVIE